MTVKTIKELEQSIGGLSKPSKMPCYSFSLPASACKIGALLMNVENSTCKGCYAFKNRYAFNVVQNALNRRLNILLKDVDKWRINITELIRRKEKSGFFRWHDSGDLQSYEHLSAIVRIAIDLPKIRFWLPTREYGLVNEYIAKNGNLPPNLTIRLSAYLNDSYAPNIKGLKTSSVSDKKPLIGWDCKAPQNFGKCGTCRACWSKKIKNVVYKKH